jgi:hypothetical protein
VKYVFGIAVLFAILGVGWQIGVAELHNFELQDDLKDLSAQMGFRTGAAPPLSDDDLRAAVIRKAARYDIELAPQQVTVRRGGVSHLLSGHRLHGSGEPAGVHLYAALYPFEYERPDLRKPELRLSFLRLIAGQGNRKQVREFRFRWGLP